MIIEPKIPKSNSNPLTISRKTKELRYIMAKRASPEFIVEPTVMNNGISAVNRRRNSPENRRSNVKTKQKIKRERTSEKIEVGKENNLRKQKKWKSLLHPPSSAVVRRPHSPGNEAARESEREGVR